MLSLKLNITPVEAKKVNANFQRALMKAMLKMEELAVDKAPVDEGHLKRNITLFPDILANRYVLTSKASYSEYMEFGTRPFYAPIKPLKDWARRVTGDEKIGYAVRAKIAKFGITAQPFARPAYYEVKRFWLKKYLEDELK
jgi:hypothetical protein